MTKYLPLLIVAVGVTATNAEPPWSCSICRLPSSAEM